MNTLFRLNIILVIVWTNIKRRSHLSLRIWLPRNNKKNQTYYHSFVLFIKSMLRFLAQSIPFFSPFSTLYMWPWIAFIIVGHLAEACLAYSLCAMKRTGEKALIKKATSQGPLQRGRFSTEGQEKSVSFGEMREEIISTGGAVGARREDVSGSDRMYFCERAGGLLWLLSPFFLCYIKNKPKMSSVELVKLYFSFSLRLSISMRSK